jgi:glucose-1-phosphate adenylyltransferase
MDYQLMLDFHKEKNADITVACMSVPYEEAHRFGIMITDDDRRIVDFEEKPEKPRSTLASMGIYIFNWKTLKEELTILKDQPNLDFGKHVLPDSREHDGRLFAYEFKGYWKDVGTLQSYWEANMGLVDIVPEFNLYEEFWPIYTNSGNINPQYISPEAKVIRSIIGEGAEICGHIHNSVIGEDVRIGKGSYVRDSIIMRHSVIGENCHIEKAIIADNTVIGNNVSLGAGEPVPNRVKPNIYSDNIVTIGENSVVPDNVEIGKNTAISGVTESSDYPDGKLASGEMLVKEGE